MPHFPHSLVLIWITVVLVCSEGIDVLKPWIRLRDNSPAISSSATIPQAFLYVTFFLECADKLEKNERKEDIFEMY